MQILSYTDHSRFNTPEIYTKGYGDIITNSSGKQYYDLTSGLWNVNYGYCSEYYSNVIQNQVDCLHYHPNHFWSTTEVTQEAAYNLANHFNMSGVYFTNGGSDAIMAAIEICRHCRQKGNVIAYDRGFHGYSKEIVYVNDLTDNIDYNTLAVIIEPIMTTHGVYSFDYEMLYNISLLQKIYDFYIIFDETVTGLGRADIDYSIQPDIIICSKGLTNGLFPMGAVIVNEEITYQMKNKPKVFNFGVTMSGHPIGAALINKSIELYDRLKDKREKLKTEFDTQLKDLPHRAYGLIYGIDVNDGRAVRNKLRKAGYITRNVNNTLIVLPMFTANIEDYKSFFELLKFEIINTDKFVDNVI